MTLITPPKPGEDVNILAPHASLRGQVTVRDGGELTVRLEPAPSRRPFCFTAGSEVEIEWIHALGVTQATATVGSAVEEPAPLLVLHLAGAVEPVERRRHERVPGELPVQAWSLSQPTRRLEGHTVDLSAGGALLYLPDLAPLAATLQAWISLPRETLTVTADVRWRKEPGLVGVQFERISSEGQAALVEYLRAHQ